MTAALAFSRLALGTAFTALFLSGAAPHRAGGPNRLRRKSAQVLVTLALGMALSALDFGLIAASDRK